MNVDDDLSDLIPGFLTHKRTDVSAILAAIGLHDYPEVGRIAHRIKGEGGSYGFNTITELGRSLGEAAAKRDEATVASLARELLNYLDHVDVVFQPSND
jgi:hypothetical protein